MLVARLSQLSLALSLLLAATCGGCSRERPDTGQPPAHGLSGPAATGASKPGAGVLPEDNRRYVWDIEHLGFVIEQKVFPVLKSAIDAGDWKGWARCLADDCSVRAPGLDGIARRQILSGQASYAHVEFASDDLQTLNAIEFLSWFGEVRAGFDDCRSGMGLVRLTPEQVDLSGNWESVWRVRIAGRKENTPVEVQFEMAVGLTELTDQIGESEKFVNSIRIQNWYSIDAQRELFSETTKESGLERAGRYDNWHGERFVPNTGGVYVSDYDLDGHLDVFVDDFNDGNRLYHGLGNGVFEDVTVEAGIDAGGGPRLWTLSCWIDVDNDGDDDLIVEDRLYENLGNGRFSDVTAETNLPLTPAAGYAVADYDADGLLDLYVCHTSAYRVGQEERKQVKWIDDGLGIDNVLYRNVGDWQFEDVTASTNAGASGSSCFAAVWLHANSDNRPDLFAINEFGVNSLLLSTPEGTFQQTDVDPVFGGFSMGVAAGDYNNDGRTDIYVANMYSKAGNRILANVDTAEYPEELYKKLQDGTRGSKLYSGSSNGEFDTVSPNDMFAYVGWAYGPTFADFDNDGWLDLYATAGFKSEERGKPDG